LSRPLFGGTRLSGPLRYVW